MANPHRGDTELRAGDRTYTLCYSSNAVCKIEAHFDRRFHKVAELLDDKEEGRHEHILTVLKYGLDRHHSDLTIEDVGDIFDEVGLNKAGEAIGTAFQRAFPDAKGGANGSSRPPKARGRARSTS